MTNDFISEEFQQLFLADFTEIITAVVIGDFEQIDKIFFAVDEFTSLNNHLPKTEIA